MSLIDNLEKMLVDGRDDAMLRFGLGNAYFQDKRWQEAAKHLGKALEHDRGYSAAWKLLGRARMQVNDLDGAREAFEDGIAEAEKKGDKQAVKEMQVFMKKIDKQRSGA